MKENFHSLVWLPRVHIYPDFNPVQIIKYVIDYFTGNTTKVGLIDGSGRIVEIVTNVVQ